jgi:4-alpha-glucanotransferase
VGTLYDWEAPSFQITAYRKRIAPEWYKRSIVYQIFPDRFCRGDDWEELAKSAFSKKTNGPDRAICENWNETPFYKKEPNGRISCWDFYGGTLSGIEKKLDYLAELGITAIYLNPIFKAASNHRYDTGDYMNVDPLLGTNEDFVRLCSEAEKRGIHIILDGVFNHTGCDSIYFNKYGNYDSVGAYMGCDSPYRPWYRFDNSPSGYESWWGVDDLPNVEEHEPSYRKFIFEDKDSVVRHWLKLGAKGWRLDVADELPDDFIEGIKTAVVETLPEDGLLLGEVWEDASNKTSYGKLRKYFLGTELDSVMNYPLLDAVYSFILGGTDAAALCETIDSLRENYPPEAFYSALNLMGSHDRMRIMTIMGEAPDAGSLSEREKCDFRLSPEKRALAKSRIWLATILQMTLPGVPCIYYGDEAGLEGYADPYNRATYPWGNEDQDMLKIYKNAISLRKKYPVFIDGDLKTFYYSKDVFGYYRKTSDCSMAVVINRNVTKQYDVTIQAQGAKAQELLTDTQVVIEGGKARFMLPPLGAAVISFESSKPEA